MTESLKEFRCPAGGGDCDCAEPGTGSCEVEAVDAAEQMEEALIEIGAILMLSADPETLLERIRQRVTQGLNHG